MTDAAVAGVVSGVSGENAEAPLIIAKDSSLLIVAVVYIMLRETTLQDSVTVGDLVLAPHYSGTVFEKHGVCVNDRVEAGTFVTDGSTVNGAVHLGGALFTVTNEESPLAIDQQKIVEGEGFKLRNGCHGATVMGAYVDVSLIEDPVVDGATPEAVTDAGVLQEEAVVLIEGAQV